MVTLFERGHIKRRSDDLNLVSSAVFAASINSQELWTDVHIVTLHEWALGLARDIASDNATTLDELTPLTNELATTKFNIQRQFVQVTPTSIIVGVDAPVIDDQAITCATLMLGSIEDFSIISSYCFGKPININDGIDFIPKNK